MLEYAKAIGANEEVIMWVNTVLAAWLKKHPSTSELEHVIDYLASDAAPNRLRKMSVTQAKEKAAKWTATQIKKGRGIKETDEDTETVHDFLDGTRIARLKTKNAYQREAFFMHHCVGGYNPETSTIYSYRDKKNEPHATFEVSKDGDSIVQVKGKGNGPIHPKYIHPILAFFQVIGLKVRPSEMSNLGYYHVPQSAIPMFDDVVDRNGRKANFIIISGEKYLCAHS